MVSWRYAECFAAYPHRLLINMGPLWLCTNTSQIQSTLAVTGNFHDSHQLQRSECYRTQGENRTASTRYGSYVTFSLPKLYLQSDSTNQASMLPTIGKLVTLLGLYSFPPKRANRLVSNICRLRFFPR